MGFYDNSSSSKELVQISVNDLSIGMYVAELDRPWLGTPFLLQGFVISSQDEIQTLQELCQHVFVEVEKQTFHAAPSHATGKRMKRPEPAQRVKWTREVPIKKEVSKAQGSFAEARKIADTVLTSIQLGQDFDVAQVKQVVSDCVDSILRNEDALLWLMQIKSKDNYTAEHCMNVGIMSAAFGKHLGHPRFELEQLGLCGMLHDIGKVKVPNEILNKPGKLTPEEFSEMRNHALYGRNILMARQDVYTGAVDVAYGHHERLNGRGYPRGVSAEKIPYFAKVVAIVDTYDAITSNRIYDGSRSANKAMEILSEGKETHFDAELVEEFIRWMGIYPPGSLVEMTNGELGIVIDANERMKLRPRVLLVLDAQKQKREQEVEVDLSQISLDETRKPYQIMRGIENGAFGIDIQSYLDRGIIQTGSGNPPAS